MKDAPQSAALPDQGCFRIQSKLLHLTSFLQETNLAGAQVYPESGTREHTAEHSLLGCGDSHSQPLLYILVLSRELGFLAVAST